MIEGSGQHLQQAPLLEHPGRGRLLLLQLLPEAGRHLDRLRGSRAPGAIEVLLGPQDLGCE